MWTYTFADWDIDGEPLSTPSGHRRRLPVGGDGPSDHLNTGRRFRGGSSRQPFEELRAQNLNVPNLHNTMTGGMKVGTSERPRLDASRNGSVRSELNTGNAGSRRHGGPIQRPGVATGMAMGGGPCYF